jgi:hypothetical protein
MLKKFLLLARVVRQNCSPFLAKASLVELDKAMWVREKTKCLVICSRGRAKAVFRWGCKIFGSTITILFLFGN